MNTPRFTEHPLSRAARLQLYKPHIFWSRLYGEWLSTEGRGGTAESLALKFCTEQDVRWTPRDTT